MAMSCWSRHDGGDPLPCQSQAAAPKVVDALEKCYSLRTQKAVRDHAGRVHGARNNQSSPALARTDFVRLRGPRPKTLGHRFLLDMEWG